MFTNIPFETSRISLLFCAGLALGLSLAVSACSGDSNGNCVDRECVAPPAALCDDDILLSYPSTGICAAGDCSYVPTQNRCENGCADGACIADAACVGVECTDLPEASCSGSTALTYSEAGICIAGACDYDADSEDCATQGLACVDGACVDLCAAVSCDPPAPYCDDTTLVTTPDAGTCAAGLCSYETDDTDCVATNQVCYNGECVTSDCVCDAPPTDACDGETAQQFASLGVCLDGTDCSYDERRIDCAALGQFCSAGECVPNDPCESLACTSPPTGFCEGDEAIGYAPGGECAAGECTYAERREDCSDRSLFCFEGVCQAEDPCEELSCPRIATTCEDEATVRVYDAVGICASGACDYTEASHTETCESGTECRDGFCATLPTFGDLVVTEILFDPDGEDDGFEWFEVFNTTETTLYLGGMIVSDLDADRFTVQVGTFITAGAHLAFTQSPSALPSGGVTWGSPNRMRLGNLDDEIILEFEGAFIDEVAYHLDSGWPAAASATLSLDPRFVDQASNDNFERWCFGINRYDATLPNLGSPNAPNPVCDFTCFDVGCAPLPGSCEGPVAVTYGQAGECVDDGTCDYSGAVERQDCRDLGSTFNCAAGRCIDVCENLTCDRPPEPACFGNRVAIFENDGTCELGACVYDVISQEPCEAGTFCDDEDGPAICVDDACASVDCDVPVDVCEDNTAVTYSGVSTCFEGVCDDSGVSETRVDCSDSDRCIGAQCVATAGATDLVITELMIDAPRADDGREWFEIYNRSATRLSIDDLTIVDEGGSQFAIPANTVIEAGESMVFAASDEALPSGFIDVVYDNALTLPSPRGSLHIMRGRTTLDTVAWTGTWPAYEDGESIAVDPAKANTTDNNLGTNWCFGVAWYEVPNTSPQLSGQGSPGLTNPDCP